jgi:hypothetical protein
MTSKLIRKRSHILVEALRALKPTRGEIDDEQSGDERVR